ncbi:AAA family ATPase [Polluticaenibacter yanchengensis]|uniref:SbcC/MukB-like Walker B domain-containing protein n=1 Tax=Polluticaenibacter yanchengensis TaxID=3014562 RepID=A0ABT4UIE6_9BACT|nr:SbcC/MukB-like Walker B domain-containing protein [Chitinophagaceae bacterium LY-5]
MKILSVHIRNINSLKGEHFINFNAAPFDGYGLFAITGATGSGKTTILDAITVALYGKVHRLDKTNINQILTKHTYDAFSEVVFEADGKTYRAKWSVKKTKGRKNTEGTLQTPKMEIAESDTGIILESEHLKTVQERIIAICGLDYEQFLRSVILSQGDFAKFLKATDKERSELLEKITDTGIYSRLGTFVYEKQKEEFLKVQKINIHLEGVKVLPDELVENYKDQLTGKEKQIAALQLAIGQKHAAIADFEQQDKYRKQLADARQKQHLLQLEKENFEPQKIQLQRHNDLLPFRTKYQEYAAMQQNAELIRSELQAYTIKLETNKKEQAATQANLNATIEKLEHAKKHLAIELPVIEKADALDAALLQLQVRINEVSELKANNNTQLQLITASRDQLANEVSTKQNDIDKLQEQLNKNKVLETIPQQLPLLKKYVSELSDIEINKTLAEKQAAALQAPVNALQTELKKLASEEQALGSKKIELSSRLQTAEATLVTLGNLDEAELVASLNQQPKNIAALEACLLSYQQIETLDHKKIDREKKIAGFNNTITTNKASLSNAELDLKINKEKLELLQTIFEKEKAIARYESERHLLVHGEACPLCGALEHPYAQQAVSLNLATAQKNAIQQTAIVEALQISVNKYSNELAVLSARTEAEASELKNIELDLEKIQENLSIQKAGFPHLNTKEDFLLELNNSKAGLEKANHDLKKFRENRQIIAELERAVFANDQAISAAKNKTAELNFSIEKHQQEITLSINKFNDLQQQQIKLADNIHQLLIPYNFGNKPLTNETILSLGEYSEKYIRKQNQLKQWQDEIVAAEKDLVAADANMKHARSENENILRLANELDTNASKLSEERTNLYGNKNTRQVLSDLQKAIESETDSMNQLKVAVSGLENQRLQLEEYRQKNQANLETLNSQLSIKQSFLADALSPFGINDINALSDLYLDDLTYRQLSNRAIELDNLLKAVAEKIKETVFNLEQVSLKLGEAENQEDLQQSLANLVQQRDELLRESGNIKQILADNEKAHSSRKEWAEQAQVQEKEYKRWLNLNYLIGSATGDRFSKFAQGLTLSYLVLLANTHLEQLNKRYAIARANEETLELQIIDKYQADVSRPIATLSGGETFLVSLALALALSQLAGNNMPIRSLFIDEGFGTLDAETLEVAISSLENLHTNDKTIGIISHIDALKERMTNQVQVLKTSGGHSQLKIVSGGVEYKQAL